MDLKYRILTSEDVEAVRKLLEKYYTNKFPLTKYLGIKNEDLRDTYYSRIESFLKQGNSFGAFDELDQIVAVFVNVKPDENEKNTFENTLKSHEKIDAINRMMIYLGQDDLPDILGTTEYWEMKMSVAHPKYRSLGVTNELFWKTFEHAKRNKIKKLVGFQAYENVPPHFKAIRRMDLREYRDSVTGQKLFSGLKPPNHVLILSKCDVDDETIMRLNSHL
ncbi:uncharacterized protein LOC120344021 [Styela clava]